MESCLCESKFWESTPAIIIIFNTCMLDLFEALHSTQYKALLSLVADIYFFELKVDAPLVVELGKQSFSAITLDVYSLKLSSGNLAQNSEM